MHDKLISYDLVKHKSMTYLGKQESMPCLLFPKSNMKRISFFKFGKYHIRYWRKLYILFYYDKEGSYLVHKISNIKTL